MSARLILWCGLLIIGWLIYRDCKSRPGISAANWWPILWVLIISSRPISTWFSDYDLNQSAEYSLEGSPIDRNGYFVLILASFVVLLKRRVQWNQLFAANKGLMVLFAYFAVSILWASSPFPSFKRWVKDFGNIFVALVILSDNDPEEAFRAVFVRCAYVLIPLSVITLRWFPDIGRAYNRHTGAMEAIGLTFQKNTLGALVLITGLIAVWDIIHRLRMQSWRKQKIDLLCRCGVLVLGAYLLNISDSMTATVSLVLGSLIIAGYGLPAVRRNAPKLMVYGSVTILALYSVDRVFGISEWIVGSLGRDMTFTGRTVVWQVLLDLKTNPVIGTGFRDFWSDMPLVSKLPEYIAGGRSAHNGYLEVYLDGGLLGVGLLAILLLSLARRIHREMGSGEEYAFVRLAVLVVALTYNFSESNFARITPVWFLFLLAALNYSHSMQWQPSHVQSLRSSNLDRRETRRTAAAASVEAH